MTDTSKRHWEQKPSPLLSLALFLALTGLMAYIRLVVFPDRFITLTYGIPMLVCLWHRDRRLLWALAFAFIAMATLKLFVLVPDENPADNWEQIQWLFQVLNIVVIAGAFHLILQLMEALHARNAALAEANEELQAQSEELAQQNEEIQRQTEEIQQQGEELQQQIEEIEQQSEELQTTNAELNERERMLQALVKVAGVHGSEQSMLTEICRMVLALFGPEVQCAAMVEKQGSDLVVRAQAGLPSMDNGRWPYKQSLAAVVMEHQRSACVHDLADRPDLVIPCIPGLETRSVLATPVRINSEITGVLQVHSNQPHAWTTRQFQLLEWAAMQSSMIIQIHRLRDGLEKLVDERTARLQELVDELEHFSYSITHDLRAPLRAMQGFAGLLVKESSSLPEPHKQYLHHIAQSSSRMDRLITDALSYTKAVRADLRLGAVDSQRLLEGIIRSYPNLQASHATVQIAGELPPVIANEAGLTQCFANLLDNAVKFVPPGEEPQVTIRAEALDGHVRFWIEDNGIGIAPEFQPYLFQMFRRASHDYNGTGIGLALVKKTCERMGGRVGVAPRSDRGSRFWIELQAASKQ